MYRLPRIILVIGLILLSVLTGCQTQTNGNNNSMYVDAEEIYLSIKEQGLDGEYLGENELEKINKFNEKYIYNNEPNKSDEVLLIEMEKLTNSYKLYFVAVGQEDKEAEERYRQGYEEALSSLDEQFK